MRLHIILFSIFIFTVAACSERGKIGFVAQNELIPDATIERIFVATTRQRRDIAYDFNGLRTSKVTSAKPRAILFIMGIPFGVVLCESISYGQITC